MCVCVCVCVCKNEWWPTGGDGGIVKKGSRGVKMGGGSVKMGSGGAVVL